MTYLDYQATTPLAPEALEAMLPWLRDQHGNPHSPHRAGRMAKAAVELAREQVAALLPPGGRVVFTSGATEALNWAIKGSHARTVVAMATEHAAVLDTVNSRPDGARAILGVDHAGLADPALVDIMLTPRAERQLVAAMLVNNEIGTIQPIADVAAAAHDAGAVMLCDAVQGYGRVTIPENVDLVAVSAHKIHGPKGIGALWIRNGVTLEPLLHGGDQEGGRSGTLSPALCAGFGRAAALMRERADEDAAHVERLWQIAVARLRDWSINGSVEQRYHGNLNVRRDGLDVARLMSDCRDIAFSAGSACASASGRSSHVLRAIGLSEAQARSSIRLGWGRYTTEAELAEALDRIVAAADAQG
ncbi:aminotransferase class V-fold PLP-dependent enzyme [Sphingomonas sp. KR1UV-12]|uniref:Cysteine desulfurase n=1 Tax=Sphingomonas aurea TaxID=3063994 RepID=A0ABT9EGB0_9SPHN|nr:aminotransferase class V-fold PLP-dependent enzyme [Sphingomonas sp. KR1UV-12]MDP1026006.1 aminotransferase class V-fold PLP-dependent enzyme [Sphingomonas sp. KR1UV-12]